MFKQLFLLIVAFSSASAQAGDVKNVSRLGATAFKALVEDIGAMVANRSQVPAEPLGITGLNMAVSTTYSHLIQKDEYRNAISGSVNNFIYSAVHVHKGLPWGIDIGGYLSHGIDNNIRHRGLELRYAVLDGGIVTPAVGLRLSASQLSNIDDLDLSTQGIDLSISKGFAVFTPYAGAGLVRVMGKTAAHSESVSLNKVFFGVGLNLLTLNVNLEYDKTGNVPSYSAKLGLRF